MADCVNNKIDGSVTGLAIAEEVCAKQLPTIEDDGFLPTWYEQEPNEYSDFGVTVETMARRPISRTRQRKKGTVVDVEALGGFNQDHTLHNNNRLLQGFFFANWQEKVTTKPINGTQVVITGITAADDRYAAASGLGNFYPGMMVMVSGATIAANNGLKIVDEVAAGFVGVEEALTNEAGSANIIITAVGLQLDNAEAAITVASGVPTMTLATAPVAADATLTIAVAQNAVAAETVTIDGVVYTFVAASDAAYEVTIGADRLATLVTLETVINGGHLLTPVHPTVTATDNGDGTLTVEANIPGAHFNGHATAEAMTQGSWSGAFAGGTGMSLRAIGLGVGQWGFLGGDVAATAYVNNRGYFRVKTISDTAIVMDKTTWDPVAEAAAGLDIQVFVGNYLQNADSDTPDDQVTHYYQAERTLGEDDDGTQAEYIRGMVADELTLNVDLADKIHADLGYIASDGETRTGLEGLKAGTRVAASNEEAINTSSDVVRMRMALIDAADTLPNPLFAYINEAKLTINNNVSLVKAIGVVGGIDVTLGDFEVGGSVTAYFTNVQAIRAIHANTTVTFDAIWARANYGMVWDIPEMTLGGGQVDVALGEPVTIPLEQMAHENVAGYTVSYTMFDYLPTLAMPVVV